MRGRGPPAAASQCRACRGPKHGAGCRSFRSPPARPAPSSPRPKRPGGPHSPAMGIARRAGCAVDFAAGIEMDRGDGGAVKRDHRAVALRPLPHDLMPQVAKSSRQGVLSDRTISGGLRRMKRSASASGTSVELSCRPTRITGASRVDSPLAIIFGSKATNVSFFSVAAPFRQGSDAENVVGPDMVRTLRPQPDARAVVEPEPRPLRLSCRNLGPFPPPDPLDAFVVRYPVCPV